VKVSPAIHIKDIDERGFRAGAVARPGTTTREFASSLLV
jgi:hypothetical protein